MMFLVDSENEAVKKLEEFTPAVEVEPSKGEEEVAAEVAGKGALVAEEEYFAMLMSSEGNPCF